MIARGEIKERNRETEIKEEEEEKEKNGVSRAERKGDKGEEGRAYCQGKRSCL